MNTSVRWNTSQALSAIALLAFTATALAQWTDDSTANTPIVTKVGEQTQVQIVPLDDGTTYASWFDNTGGGYDVFLQRIDADGNRMWDEDGLLIADRSFSSTQDYALSADGDNHAWLTFRDDRFGDVQITVARISPDGDLIFGDDGVQVTNDNAFKAAPQIAAIDNTSAIVAWTHDSESRIARVSGTGAVLWTQSVALPTNSTSVSDVRSAGDNAAIVLLVNQGSFIVPRHLYAQKYDRNGNTLWGTDPIVIFNSGSLQFGNFPDCIATNDGGMAVAWYQNSPALQVYVQRIDNTGSALFPAGGLPVSTNANQLRVEPDAAFDEVTGDTYVFWRETNLNQNQFGVYGQRITDQGQRAWSDSGLSIVPLSDDTPSQVRVSMLLGDAVLAFNQVPLGSTIGTLFAARLDANGDSQWSPMLTTASDAPSGKSRLRLITSANDTAILAWADNRDTTNDIYAQQITADGELGSVEPDIPGDINGDGVVNVDDLLIVLNNWGSCADCDDCPADVTGDCVVNVDDLLMVLNNWG